MWTRSKGGFLLALKTRLITFSEYCWISSVAVVPLLSDYKRSQGHCSLRTLPNIRKLTKKNEIKISVSQNLFQVVLKLLMPLYMYLNELVTLKLSFLKIRKHAHLSKNHTSNSALCVTTHQKKKR